MSFDSVPMFHALEWTTSAQGRRMAVVRCDRQRTADNTGLTDRDVLIDGTYWHCTAVHRDSVTNPILAREKIGLWVEPTSPNI
jgi:hypothetical protein